MEQWIEENLKKIIYLCRNKKHSLYLQSHIVSEPDMGLWRV